MADKYLDDIAAALHPHWNGESGHTYLANQLAGMVRKLQSDLHAAINAADTIRRETRRECAEMVRVCGRRHVFGSVTAFEFNELAHRMEKSE